MRFVSSSLSGSGADEFEAPGTVERQWGDTEYRERQEVYNKSHTKYYAEGFPSVFINFGPGSLTPCIGGTYSFASDTVWFENKPLFAGNWETRKIPALDRKSPMYLMIEDFTNRILSHSDKLIASISDIGGTYDIVAALRGTENLLYDMYDYPEEIKKLRNEVAPLWKEYFLEQSERLIREQGCMSSWMEIWSDIPYFTLQCDYSAMLSPDMFREYVLPDLTEQTEYMPRSIYHLDGVGELPHLDMVLSIPRLNAVQWVPGAGKPNVTDPCWFDIYRRIQAAGKGVIILGADPAGLENLFANVSQKGFYINVLDHLRDEKDAEDIIASAEQLNF